MTYIAAYVITLLLFAVVDITWLVTMGGQLYKQTLGDILLSDVRMAPAAAFYLLYAAGLVIFGVVPALKSGSPTTALVFGGLFGLFNYATYELTNLATLRNWTVHITLIDIVYGCIASGIVAACAAALTPGAVGLLGLGGR